MIKTLRSLLISLVAAAPLLAVLQMAAAEACSAIAIGAVDSSPLEGTREDDAGAFASSEQTEEDDSEQEPDGTEHACTGGSPTSLEHAPGRPLVEACAADSVAARPLLSRSRGPPLRG